MAETPKALSVSFRQDAGSIEHNNRIFVADNVDGSRSADNIIYVQKDLREFYHELFDGALAEYNSSQTRKDRVIENYYDHVKRGKREKLFQEIVVTFGNSETCGVGSKNWQTAIRLLDEYMKKFEKRNPNLRVFNAVMHLDEATPHLHIDRQMQNKMQHNPKKCCNNLCTKQIITQEKCCNKERTKVTIKM